MRKIVPIALWLMVICFVVALVYMRGSISDSLRSGVSGQSSDQTASDDPPGAAFVDVPWKHLPDVERFQFLDQNGEQYDSANLTGRPYLVSFFFASCPSFCRDLNKRLDRLNEQLRKEDIAFVSISVDPKNDTPEVLNRYAADFNATPDRWAFLTDQEYKIKQLGEQVFQVVVDKDTHTDNILLVDKWGRYRDRFKWDDPYDMKRLVKVVKDVAAEQDPPLDQTIHTRNVLAGYEQPDLNLVPWVREFHLTERSGNKFFSRDLTGEVWIANFFFSTCPGICKEQNTYIRNLRQRLGDQLPQIVSITTDPSTDTPEVLREYAAKFDADDRWKFCTGQSLLIKRISSEFFHAHASDNHHSSLLFVMDRWGKRRGSFDWQNAEEEIAMLKLIDELKLETRPQIPVDENDHSEDEVQ